MRRAALCLVTLLCLSGCRAQPPAPPAPPDLKPFVGKLATESGLLGPDTLGKRLQALMGEGEYRAMLADWQTQTPIEEESGIFHASGCRAHDCLAVNYQLFVEPARDTISVFRLRDNAIKSFEEKGPIALPKQLSSDFENLKRNFNDPRFK